MGSVLQTVTLPLVQYCVQFEDHCSAAEHDHVSWTMVTSNPLPSTGSGQHHSVLTTTRAPFKRVEQSRPHTSVDGPGSNSLPQFKLLCTTLPVPMLYMDVMMVVMSGNRQPLIIPT